MLDLTKKEERIPLLPGLYLPQPQPQVQVLPGQLSPQEQITVSVVWVLQVHFEVSIVLSFYRLNDEAKLVLKEGLAITLWSD